MTIEEAIETIQYASAFNSDNSPLTRALEMAISALRAQRETGKNERLTLKELREMGGQPIYLPDLEAWAIVECDSVGRWAGLPFAHGLNFNYNIKSRRLKCFRRPPEKEA